MALEGEAVAFDGSQDWLGMVVPPIPAGGTPFSVSLRQSLGADAPPLVVEVDDADLGTTNSWQATPDVSGLAWVALLLTPGVDMIRFGPRPALSGTLEDVSYWVDWSSPPSSAPVLTGSGYGFVGMEFVLPTGAAPLPPASTAPPTLLSVDDNPAIRAAIRTNLSIADLPDTAIAFGYGPAAQQVLAVDPYAGTWPSDSVQASRDHDAAVLLAAAYLVPSVPSVARESFLNYSYSIDAPRSEDRAASLREMAIAMLVLNVGQDLAALQPVNATLAPGGRGDVRRHRLGYDLPVRLPPAYP